MPTSESVIGELEAAVQGGNQEQRINIMRQVTALFLGGADRFTSEQVDIFDDVLTRLVAQVESRALAELGASLAPVDNAPHAVIQRLARHDEIAVAGPVLAQSRRLSDQDLIEIAQTKGQAHLGAISERSQIAATVTDVLVDRGNSAVVSKLSRNQGASFSDAGFTRLAKRAETDAELADILRTRPDLSPQLFRELVLKATDAVRKRLLASASPEVQATIHNVLASVSGKVMQAGVRDFKHAEALIARLSADNHLNEAAIADFASAGRYEEMLVGLAQLCAAPTELVQQLLEGADYKGTLVACKAAKLHWPASSAVLNNRAGSAPLSQTEMEQARADFLQLSVATAQRMFRFWIVRGVAKHRNEFSSWTVN